MTGLRPLEALAVVAALLTASGCPNGDHDPPAAVITDPGEVIALVAQRAAGLETLAVEARVTQYSDARVIKGKLAILVERPAAVHFSGLSPTDDVVSVLATDGLTFTSFERGADVCYTGRACPENVGRLVPIAMESRHLAGVLYGRPPLIAHGARSVEWDRRAGAYRLELEGTTGQRQRLWVRHGTGLIERARLLDGDEVTVDLAYEDFREVGGYTLPHRIDVKMKRGDTDLRLDYRHVDVNLELQGEPFDIPCPEGTRVERLPCFDEQPTREGP